MNKKLHSYILSKPFSFKIGREKENVTYFICKKKWRSTFCHSIQSYHFHSAGYFSLIVFISIYIVKNIRG